MKNQMRGWLCVCMSVLMLLTMSVSALAEGTQAQSIEAATTPEAQTTETTEKKTEKAEWTVMVYMCGTDLESRWGMATYNLTEIAGTDPNDAVNVVIQTGGTKSWEAARDELGLEISNEKLQRWTYDENGYAMVDEQPDANMADGRTLTDFIKWTADNYPAEKYLLVAWDHGGGSMRGLILDELHNEAVMSLEDFGGALQNSGVHMEAIVLDTCLMASLETAQAVQDSANYLIAAEETVPGVGTAYEAWLQYLYDYPYINGRQFGRYFCDAVQTKYAELNDESSSLFLTFSCIDLSRIDAVSEAFDAMFGELRALLDDAEMFGLFSYMTKNTDSYSGTGMIDLMDMARRARKYGLSAKTAGDVIDSVSEAVVANVKGLYHSYSQGLSFWYNPTSNFAVLDHYARNCRSAQYLAFLDEVNMGWTAPAWVYEQVERQPDIGREDYVIEYELSKTEDGHLQLTITNGVKAVMAVDYRLLKAVDKETNQWVSLGRDFNVVGDFETGIFRDNFNGTWPTLGGALCCMDMIDSTSKYSLYNVRIGQLQDSRHPEYGYNSVSLRVGYIYDAMLSAEEESAAQEQEGTIPGHYEMYGIWTGMSNNIELPSRDSQPVSLLYGETMTTLCPIYDPVSRSTGSDVAMGRVTFSEKTDIEVKPLGRGTYAYEFIITDVFGQEITTLYVPFSWDGEKTSFRVDDANMMRENMYLMYGMSL